MKIFLLTIGFLLGRYYKHKYKSNRLHVTNKLDEWSEIFDEQ